MGEYDREKMVAEFGPDYLKTKFGRLIRPTRYSYKRLRYSWLVYRVGGAMHATVQSRAEAIHLATALNLANGYKPREVNNG